METSSTNYLNIEIDNVQKRKNYDRNYQMVSQAW